MIVRVWLWKRNIRKIKFFITSNFCKLNFINGFIHTRVEWIQILKCDMWRQQRRCHELSGFPLNLRHSHPDRYQFIRGIKFQYHMSWYCGDWHKKSKSFLVSLGVNNSHLCVGFFHYDFSRLKMLSRNFPWLFISVFVK